DHFATYATLYRLDPGAKVRMQQSSRASIGPRFGYFGGHGPAGARVFDNEWAARGRLAALISTAYRVAEMQVACKRVDRVQRDAGTFSVPGAPAPVGGGRAPQLGVEALLTTQYGAALVLDQHINAPGYVRTDLRTAINSTPGAAFDAAGHLWDAWTVAL